MELLREVAGGAATFSGAEAANTSLSSPSVNLAQLILDAEDDCSHQFAHALHDGLSQLLMALQAHFQVFELATAAGKTEKADQELDKAREALRQSVRECRRLVSGMETGSDLISELQALVEDYGERWNWKDFGVVETGSFTESPRSPEEVQTIVSIMRRVLAALRRRTDLSVCLQVYHHQETVCVLQVTSDPACDAGADFRMSERPFERVSRLVKALGGKLCVERLPPSELWVRLSLPYAGAAPAEAR